MDKKTILAFVLIALIFIVFTWINKPSEAELARQQHYQDSVALVEQQRLAAIAADSLNSTAVSAGATAKTDSIAQTAKFGAFDVAAAGTESFYTLENELVKVVISSKGGRIYSAELKNYKTHNQ